MSNRICADNASSCLCSTRKWRSPYKCSSYGEALFYLNAAVLQASLPSRRCAHETAVSHIRDPLSHFTLDAVYQFIGLGDVVCLTPSERFSGLPRASTLTCTFVLKPPRLLPRDATNIRFLCGAPAAQGCARTVVLSIIRCSISGSSAECWCIFSHIPCSWQSACTRCTTCRILPEASSTERLTAHPQNTFYESFTLLFRLDIDACPLFQEIEYL